MPSEGPLQTLLAVLRCPGCRVGLRRASECEIACPGCGRRHAITDGILHINALDEHPEVVQERASVPATPATESAPELGGWREDVYAPSLDPESSLGQANLSLP